MSLDMLDHIDDTFATGTVIITPLSGSYVRGVWTEGAVTPTAHEATKQVANSEELKILSSQGERFTDVARFYISDGSQHSVGDVLTDAHGKKYRIFNADCRPERNYCKLLGTAFNG